MTTHEPSPPPGSELSRGVVSFLHRGSAASPRADDDAVRAVAGDTPGDELVAQVRAVVSECLGVRVDWTSLSLGEAGRAVAAEIGRRHPELDAAALDALAWNVSHAWR